MTNQTPESEFMEIRVSGERDNICEWVMDRFRALIAEERVDDALLLRMNGSSGWIPTTI